MIELNEFSFYHKPPIKQPVITTNMMLEKLMDNVNMFWSRFKIVIKALFTGKIKYLTNCYRDELDPDLRTYPRNDESATLRILSWLNRNRLFMDLVPLDQQHVVSVVILGGSGKVCISCHLAQPNSEAEVHRLDDGFICNHTKLEDKGMDGVFNYYQKRWEHALGARYAPFMTPIRGEESQIYYHSDPLFCFTINLDEQTYRELFNPENPRPVKNKGRSSRRRHHPAIRAQVRDTA